MRKTSRLLSLLLIVCVLMSMASSAFAYNYEVLFASLDPWDEETLVEALLSDTDQFVNELAFRDAKTKEYVISYFIHANTSKAYLTAMQSTVSKKLAEEVYRTKSEQALLELLYYRLSYWLYSLSESTLNCWGLFADAELEYNKSSVRDSLIKELAKALVAEPVQFVQLLAAQRTSIQTAVVLHLSMNTDEMGNVLYDILVNLRLTEADPPLFTDRERETLDLCLEALEPMISEPVYPQDPDPEELQQWLAQKNPPSTSDTTTSAIDYDGLFEHISSDDVDELVSAFLADPAQFVNELAFRDAQTKQNVLDALTVDWVTDAQLRQMFQILQEMQTSPSLTQSETKLLEVMVFRLEYEFYNRPQPHRDCRTLFAESLNVPPDGLDTFCDEVRFAVIEDPKNFIVLLAQEEPDVQVRIAYYLFREPPYSLLVRMVFELLAQEYNVGIQQEDYFTEAELHLVSLIVFGVEAVPVLWVPEPSDPNLQELQLWLEQKYLPVEKPIVHPVQTQPATIPTEETLPQQVDKNTDPAQSAPNWILTICLVAAAFAAGCAVAGGFRKRD